MSELTFISLFSGIGGLDRCMDWWYNVSRSIHQYQQRSIPAMANQYTYNPPFTEEQLHEAYVTEGLTQIEVARRYGTTLKVVQIAMRKMGIQPRKAIKRDQTGAKNTSWKGGRVLSARGKRADGDRATFGNGYYYIRQPDHPNANKSGYVAEHILVATQAAGRGLAADECVHHIDMHKHNNDPANLCICTRKKHGEYHNQLEMLAVKMLQAGLITFTPEAGYDGTPDFYKLVQRNRGT